MHREHRNASLINHLALEPKNRDDKWAYYSNRNHRGALEWAVQLPAGVDLQIDRIYIRKGLSDFDSVSFIVADSPDKSIGPRKNGCKTPIRFWVKLEDVNGMLCDILD